jgi:hypothetical protein
MFWVVRKLLTLVGCAKGTALALNLANSFSSRMFVRLAVFAGEEFYYF